MVKNFVLGALLAEGLCSGLTELGNCMVLKNAKLQDGASAQLQDGVRKKQKLDEKDILETIPQVRRLYIQ